MYAYLTLPRQIVEHDEVFDGVRWHCSPAMSITLAGYCLQCTLSNKSALQTHETASQTAKPAKRNRHSPWINRASIRVWNGSLTRLAYQALAARTVEILLVFLCSTSAAVSRELQNGQYLRRQSGGLYFLHPVRFLATPTICVIYSSMLRPVRCYSLRY